MSFFQSQNPGIGGLEEVTDSEALFLQNLAALSYAQGDILYHNGTNLTRLPKGTASQFLKMNAGATAPEWGSGGAGTIDGSGTTNELTYWVDADTLGSLAVATYPSLTELSYVKGVTSSLQTQINAKSPIASPTFTGTVSVPATNFTVGASLPFSDSAGTLTLQNVDALDATTEATIEAAIDTLANLTSIQGQTISIGAKFTIPADPNADRLFFWDDSATDTAWLSLGNGLTITTTSIAVDSASDTVDGIVELAIASEVTTGTDTTRAVTPDALAGSDYGKREVQITVVEYATDVTTGDGKAYFRVPASLNGYNLVGVYAKVITAGTTGTSDIQIANVTDAVDILSTKMTIDSTETDTATAATPAVINAANDDVATADLLRIDVDAVSTTKPKGLIVGLTFQLP